MDPLAPAARDAPPNNLPLQATPLIGRADDAESGCRLLRQPHVRLVTLTGPAGVGKTRLALEVAAQSLVQFSDGVFFVDLAPIEDPTLVAATIGQVIGVQEGLGRSLPTQLRQYLGPKHLLLLLDNFEQVVGAAGDVAELLSGCPNLKVLVTSRVPLELRWEHRLPVPPLALPDLARQSEQGALLATASVALFVERAETVKPDFMASGTNAFSVSEICTRLDGLPLAIELCAAQADVLSTSLILDGLRRAGLDLLTGGARDVPSRHQTLRAAIGWSERMLDSDERTLFGRMSVFVGGCTLAAAESVCGALGHGQLDVAKAVASLLRKNLLRLEPLTSRDEPRIRMLEMVREYAAEQLSRSGETAGLRARHRDWCLALAQEADAAIRGLRQREWLDRLEAEHDNLRAALAWNAQEELDAEPFLKLAGALAWFWRLHGHMTEGRRWLHAALAAAEGIAAPERAHALNGAGLLAYAQGDYGTAKGLLQESLDLAVALADARAVAWAQHGLGRVAYGQGEHARAAAAFEQSLSSFAAAEDIGGSAYSLFFWGCSARDLGDRNSAAALFEESLNHAEACGDTWILAFAHYITGNLAWVQGDLRRADAYYGRGLILSREIRAKWPLAECLWGFSGLAAARGEWRRAARLYGAERALREAVGAVVLGEAAVYERSLTDARTALGDLAFAAEAAEGRRMTLDEAIDYALSDGQGVESTNRSLSDADAPSRGPLTARESEVAELVAQGLSNRRIAERLVIAKPTADRHVSNILSKLNLASRSQLTAWVIEQRHLAAGSGQIPPTPAT